MKKLKTNSIAFIYITCSYRNTLITITNTKKETLFQNSSKSAKINIKRKNNPYVLNKIALQIIYKLRKLKYRRLGIFIKGVGFGRYHIAKHLIKYFRICIVKEITALPFNGCKSKKQKRK